MRRLLALLAMAAVGLASPVQAAKAPPKKPVAAKKKPCAKKPRGKKPRAVRACAKRKPVKKPVVRQPAAVPTPAPAPAPAAPQPVVEVPAVVTPEAPAVGVPAPVVLPSSPAPVAAPLPRIVSITEREFSLTLTDTILGAGSIRVEVRNWGEDAHDLRIDGVGNPFAAAFDEMEPGARIVKTLTMSAGSYRLWCTLPGHAGLGMDKPLTVGA